MSGPKVVRIVTREEIEAICRGHLRAVDAALAALRHCAESNGVLDSSMSAMLQSRSDALQRLFAAERWLDLQKQAPLEVAFLREQQAHITAVAIERAEKARRTRRRLSDAARSFVIALEAAGQPVSSKLRHATSGLDRVSDDDLSAVEAELSAALTTLTRATAHGKTSSAVDELATRLGANEKGATLSDWLSRQEPTERNSIRRLDKALAEARVLDPPAAGAFLERALQIDAERSPDHQALLADSLMLDIASHLERVRAWNALAPALSAIHTSLQESAAPAAAALLHRLEIAMTARDQPEATAIAETARVLLDHEAKHTAARARRAAVLKALAALGYEVRENMVTAWAASGRIVLKRPGSTDYGIELGAVGDAERVQMQVVGAANPVEARNAARDRDAETMFCSQVETIKGALAQSGAQLVIEHALAVGAQKVKSVTFADPTDRDSSASTPIERRLP